MVLHFCLYALKLDKNAMFLDLPSGLLKCGKLGHPVQMEVSFAG